MKSLDANNNVAQFLTSSRPCVTVGISSVYLTDHLGGLRLFRLVPGLRDVIREVNG